jgi:hypothetical protein
MKINDSVIGAKLNGVSATAGIKFNGKIVKTFVTVDTGNIIVVPYSTTGGSIDYTESSVDLLDYISWDSVNSSVSYVTLPSGLKTTSTIVSLDKEGSYTVAFVLNNSKDKWQDNTTGIKSVTINVRDNSSSGGGSGGGSNDTEYYPWDGSYPYRAYIYFLGGYDDYDDYGTQYGSLDFGYNSDNIQDAGEVNISDEGTYTVDLSFNPASYGVIVASLCIYTGVPLTGLCIHIDSVYINENQVNIKDNEYYSEDCYQDSEEILTIHLKNPWAEDEILLDDPDAYETGVMVDNISITFTVKNQSEKRLED